MCCWWQCSSSRVAPHLTDGGPVGQLEETGVNAATVTSGDGVSNEFCSIDDVLLTMILANTVTFSVLPKLSSFTGGGKYSYAYVVNILRARHTPNHVTTQTSFPPSHL